MSRYTCVWWRLVYSGLVTGSAKILCRGNTMQLGWSSSLLAHSSMCNTYINLVLWPVVRNFNDWSEQHPILIPVKIKLIYHEDIQYSRFSLTQALHNVHLESYHKLSVREFSKAFGGLRTHKKLLNVDLIILRLQH